MNSSLPVTVLYQTEDTAYNTGFDIYAVLLDHIEIVKEPNKTKYKRGEKITYTGLKVNAVYSNGDTEDITDGCEITPAGRSEFSGEYRAEVSYNGHKAYIDFTEISLTSLTISRQPTKTTYKSGEKISYRGLKITAKYSDGSTADVTNKCAFSVEEGSVINSDLTVNAAYTEGYNQVSADFELKVKYVTGIKVDRSSSAKTDIYVGDDVQFNDLTILAEYDDGSVEDVTDDCDFYGTTTDGETGEETTSLIARGRSKGEKLSNAKTKLTPKLEIANPDGSAVEFTLPPLNEPEVKSIEPMSVFYAPKPEEQGGELPTNYPLFTLGCTKLTPMTVRHFVQGTLVSYAVTFGMSSDGAYTEDIDGNKIGKWITYQTIPDKTANVWCIDPATGRKMGSILVPIKYNESVEQISSESYEWETYTVLGWDVDFEGNRHGQGPM